MKKKFFTLALSALALTSMFVSCNESNNDPEPNANYAITLDLPLNQQNGTLSDTKATLTNVQTKQQYPANSFNKNGNVYVDSISVPQGLYNIEVTGKISYKVNSQNVVSMVKAKQENVNINLQAASNHNNNITMALNTFSAAQGFVISEIFFTGTQTSEGKTYTDDQYFRIANNSNETLYADGLAIVQADFLSTDKQDYTPNLLDSAITIDAIYVIPGNGTDYPILPGQEITIALNAINHKEYNPNSIDLSKADFEFYDAIDGKEDIDVDNKDVPNLINWYNNFKSGFILHNRGFKSYALVKPEVDIDTFNKNFKYKYNWKFVFGQYSFDRSDEAFFIPNSWVIDGVNLSVPSLWQWNVMSETIDAGYTHCGQVDKDQNRFGKAVVRKKNSNMWVDTNNSTNDFEADAKPSLF